MIFFFMCTYYCWNYEHENIKENISCASFVILLLSIFGALGQKVEVLLSTFCDIKTTLEWISPRFLDLLHHYALPSH